MKHVAIYTTKTCPYCRSAKALLTSKGVVYEEISLEEHPELRDDVMRRSGRRTVPQVFIGDQPVGGFDDIKALDEAGKLDELLAE